LAHRKRAQALIIQSANVYQEGLGAKWAGIAQYWSDPKGHPEVFDTFASFAATEQRHTLGTSHPEHYNPGTWRMSMFTCRKRANATFRPLCSTTTEPTSLTMRRGRRGARAQTVDFGRMGPEQSIVYRAWSRSVPSPSTGSRNTFTRCRPFRLGREER